MRAILSVGAILILGVVLFAACEPAPPVDAEAVWGPPPAPLERLEIDGVKIEGNDREGFVFAGTCVRAMFLEVGDVRILGTTCHVVDGVEWAYDPKTGTWSEYEGRRLITPPRRRTRQLPEKRPGPHPRELQPILR